MNRKKKAHYRATCFDAAGRVISTAENSYKKTHPKQAAYAKQAGLDERIFLHAEILAIIRARKPIHSLFVERYGTDGKAKLAKPCKICEFAIHEAKIKMVTYTTNE